MNESAIEVRGLEKQYPSFRLGPLNLTVPQGAIYGFIGPNGAGKTTTLDLIMGMGREDAGRISVLGLHHWDRIDQFAWTRRPRAFYRPRRDDPSRATARGRGDG